MPAWPCRNFYCTSSDEMCGEQHVCTRLADHDGDHYDAVTERRWHNAGQTYGRPMLAPTAKQVANFLEQSRHATCEIWTDEP